MKKKVFRLKKNQYWFNFICKGPCGKKSRYVLPKGEEFPEDVLATLKCSECVWGGPGGVERCGKAAKRLQKKDLFCLCTSPGPEFYFQVWAEDDGQMLPHTQTFDLGIFEGAPVRLQVLFRGTVGVGKDSV